MPIEWMQLTLSQSIFDFCRLSLTFLKLSNINKFVLRILWHMCSSDKCFDDAGRNVCLLRVGIKRLKKQIFNFVRLRHTSTLGCYSSLSFVKCSCFLHTLYIKIIKPCSAFTCHFVTLNRIGSNCDLVTYIFSTFRDSVRVFS